MHHQPESIYLDNAATSWPKPECVPSAMLNFLTNVGANPGRSGHHLSIQAGRIINATRESLCTLFGADDPLKVVFGPNATEALNLALLGLVDPGDHIITTSMEHNAVMRPLRRLEHHGVRLSVVTCDPTGLVDPTDIQKQILPNTKLIATSHASNIVGTLQPIAQIGRIAREHDLLFLVDAAASAGCVPIDMKSDKIDLLAFTGHKSLLGPTGTGGLLIGDRVDATSMRPLKRGGTGSNSASEEQPGHLPDAFESGTLNAVGLAGLCAAVDWIREKDVAKIRRHHQKLTQILIDGLATTDGVTVYGPGRSDRQTTTLSFNLNNMQPSEAGYLLDTQYKICCRVGLHCAPSAHRTIGTYPKGTVRFAPGMFTTMDHIETALRAVANLTRIKP